MTEFVATFPSHYDAIRFKKENEADGLVCTLRPVPRSISSSCGTCAMFKAENWDGVHREMVEGIFSMEAGGWKNVWRCS